jgi:formylglycine-generating enzyme required for sulfatase activity
VIDLSGGVLADDWPVTYHPSAEALPSGGLSNDLYRTSRLVLRRIRTHGPPPEDGAFVIGSPVGSLGRGANEAPHPVQLTHDYYIGVFELTQTQWYLAMSDTARAWPSAYSHPDYRRVRPVEQVSFHDIRANINNTPDAASDWPANSHVTPASFVGRLRAKTGVAAFDLPTEAQWEYAARAGTTGALNDGTPNITNNTSDARLDRLGRYGYNGGNLWDPVKNEWSQPQTVLGVAGTAITPDNATAPVGSYAPNAWGLYDTHGNVVEWVLDWYAPFTAAAQTDPAGPAAPVSGTQRTMRGGSWNFPASSVRLSSRMGRDSTWRTVTSGFRVAWTLPAF